MRVISLTDGRICYLDAARSKADLPPGQGFAAVNIPGRPRFGVPLPGGWEAMQESELRQRVEEALQARLARSAASETAAPTAHVPPRPRTRGFLARLLQL